MYLKRVSTQLRRKPRRELESLQTQIASPLLEYRYEDQMRARELRKLSSSTDMFHLRAADMRWLYF